MLIVVLMWRRCTTTTTHPQSTVQCGDDVLSFSQQFSQLPLLFAVVCVGGSGGKAGDRG